MEEENMSVALRLLSWYDRHARLLPWRSPPGTKPGDPYKVWLSEIMLQQTTVVAVKPYFEAFLQRWPRVEDLAAAPLDDVLTAWAGLGYYARARNLHRCAVQIAEEYGGRFPKSEKELLKLPGIGPYTAAAIAAIAFGKKTTVVDGNVERVVTRLFALKTPLPDAKPEIKAHAETLTAPMRPGDYAQAMMDLGATLCLPRNPKCVLCPLRELCRACEEGQPESYPFKKPKALRPLRHGVAYLATRLDGAILLRRRAAKGLLGGMMEVPSSPWRDAPWNEGEALEWAPLDGPWREMRGLVRHTFTHFHLELRLWQVNCAGEEGLRHEEGEPRWVFPDRLGEEALPSLMRKVIDKGLAEED